MHVRALFESTPAGAALEYLRSELKIHVVEDARAALVSLKYNQIESPMDNPLVAECRGMVVDISTDHAKILAHPYNKFWNYGDLLAPPIDWATARVMDKLDGSLMIMFLHPGTGLWSVASSGHPTAGGSFGSAADMTFREAFWERFWALGMRTPETGWVSVPGYGDHDLRTCTFMFELCDAPNRVVVRHEKPRLVLHGIRSLFGHELAMEEQAYIAGFYGWEYVKHYPLASIEECLAAAAAIDPLANEGFVVVDAAWNRVKIKSPRYVLLHHMKGEATPRRAIELWQTGETSELLSHFPEMAPLINQTQTLLDLIALRAYDAWNDNKAEPDRKSFAAKVKDLPVAPVTFKLLGIADPSPDTAAEIMRGMSLAALERLVASEA